MGETVRVGDVGEAHDVVVLVVVVVLSGEGAVGEVIVVGDWGWEKTVRSFWRERAGERRWEGMVFFFCVGVA